jgi:glycerol-3-phosphate dehydrogenase (NAD(P)+)
VCWGTKGFEPNSGRLPSAVFHEVLTTHGAVPAVISGPSFANEVALGLPTALTVGCEDDAATQQFTAWFRNERVRVYTSTDLVGIQLGGAIKNVMAIATGICDGLGLGANARAALITRALAEMTRFGMALGGQAKTFSGLTGVGDLLLTATDDQSRNRRLGIGLGGGGSITKLVKEIGQEIEGINTTRVLYEKSRELGIQMPISEQVYRVIFDDLDPASAVTTLLGRAPREETD